MKFKNKTVKRWIIGLFLSFLFLNIVTIFIGYRLTHFSSNGKAIDTSRYDKAKARVQDLVYCVIGTARPKNDAVPYNPYETISFESNDLKIEGWYIPARRSKGTVIMFHGYISDKSKLIEKSNKFHEMGYTTFLIDFMGSGGSEGRQTTLGYYEADQVKEAYKIIKNRKKESNIILFGTSMGAAAVMNAVKDHDLTPHSIILESPFGSMLEAVEARFRLYHIPSFPCARILVFWGGLINGFNAFDHNPYEYAQDIHVPSLILYGEQDDRVTREEIDNIYNNLKGPKKLATYPEAGHKILLKNSKNNWEQDITQFLTRSSEHVEI
ncbi:alpha/beta hydrolase [Fulvivirga sediminis]|uniref:Alpha/beta hydrolase n=1 Tax=Fulvivirga sediminis TaxID=2803949 RepID=A0A937FAV1_9BACT|nr:alpha/beta hydrolase [Fulvivirga sediminis]MBL3658850.1 alpha/beta hydrolase [Fulvivirga sediminis]